MATGTTNVHVEKNPNENSMGLIRRFTKRVQNAGILPRKRSIRYRERPSSSLVIKKKKLKSLKRKAEVEELIKLGKIEPQTQSRGRRRR